MSDDARFTEQLLAQAELCEKALLVIAHALHDRETKSGCCGFHAGIAAFTAIMRVANRFEVSAVKAGAPRDEIATMRDAARVGVEALLDALPNIEANRERCH